MDLTLFIIFIILIYLIYYMTNVIQSLNKELKEIKNKCIKAKITSADNFSVNTPDVNIKENFIGILDFLKNKMN